ncbi:MAG: class I SAM-dependent methyltransferase [Planctomycetota bacterium]
MRLDTVVTETPCCLTGSRDAVVVAEKDRHGKPLRTVISTESGLVFTDPRPTDDEVRRFYSEEYRLQYKQTHTPKLKHILRAGRNAHARLDRVNAHLTPGARVLDAGSGGGEFLHACRAAGYEARGVEPNEGYARFAAEQYGVDVFNGFYEDLPFAPGSFDCVTLFHVLEHLQEPVEAIRLLANSLKVGGVLVVEVPDVESTDTAPNQKWHLGHLFNFSRATLLATGARAGLEAVSTGNPGGNLEAVFRKASESTEPLPTDDVLCGSFDRTLGILTHHTAVRHYSLPLVPISRLVKKVARTFDEKRVTRPYQELPASELLDDLAARRIA